MEVSSETDKKCGLNDFVLDESFKPQNDFFNHVNNLWIKENPIPDDFVRWGVFESLQETTRKRLLDLVTGENSEPRIGSIYKKGMDQDKLQSDGIKPVKELLKKIDSVETIDDMFVTLGEYAMYGLTCFFGTDVYPDAKESTKNVLYFSQSGLGMPDRDYYVLEQKEKEREGYKKYLLNIFEKFEINNHVEAAKRVYQLEEQLAKISLTRTERRDPHKTYNLYNLEKLEAEFPRIQWTKFMKNTNLFDYAEWNTTAHAKIVLDNPKFFSELNTIMEMEDYTLQDFKWFITNHVINSVGSYVDNESYNIIFDYYGRVLSGQKEIKPRWKRVLTSVQTNLGELLGKQYVAAHFPEESKKKALILVNDLQESLREKIENLEWMTKATKEKALKKMDHFTVKIGYPDKWRDFSGLILNDDGSYLENTLECRRFNINWEYAQLEFPVDRSKWEMNPQEINAYYHPLLNEIVFPAGILQAPFFDANQSDALNYGAIGAIIGHEMTHGFDDQGRKFDYQGNMNDWWTEEDVKEYSKRTDLIVTQYKSYKIEGENLNGELTLGENIADIGGLLIAFNAFKKRAELEGCNRELYSEYQSEQMMKKHEKDFFMGWGRAWRSHIRPEAQKQRILVDPHSPPLYRVNGVLKNIPDFHRIFKTTKGDSLYLSSENQAKIW